MPGNNKLGPTMRIKGVTKPEDEDKRRDTPYLFGTLAVVFLGAICCGGPLVFGAITLVASGVASSLGISWPLTVGIGIGLLLALLGLRFYLRRRRRTKPPFSSPNEK